MCPSMKASDELFKGTVVGFLVVQNRGNFLPSLRDCCLLKTDSSTYFVCLLMSRGWYSGCWYCACLRLVVVAEASLCHK